MNRAPHVIALVFVVTVSLSFATQSIAGEELYKMTGYITAIDREYRTVVIEVPMVGKIFTVGGPLASGAVLKKGGVSVGLGEFQVGAQVVVTGGIHPTVTSSCHSPPSNHLKSPATASKTLDN